MATAKAATKLSDLDTKGVALVRRGANNKRIAMTKGANGELIDDTIEALFLEVIAKGDMAMDDAAVADMCAKAGLDPQATETFKAILKLAYAYQDSAAMKGLLKQVFTAQAAPAAGQPGMPGQQPPSAPPTPGAPAVPPSAPPTAQAAAPPGAPGKPPVPGQEGATAPKVEPGEGTPGEEQQDAAGTEPGEGTPAEEAGDEKDPKKKPPFGKAAPQGVKESDMDEKKVAEMVAKAAADAKAEADAKIKEQEAVIKSQQTALDANTLAVSKMQDDLKLSQWVAKAEKDLNFIAGKTAEELGKTLFDLDKLNPALAVQQFELLKSQAAVIKSSNLFRPMGIGGTSGAPAASAFAEVEKRTVELVTKSAGNGEPEEVRKARAQVAVLKADPSLYKRYCDEQEQTNQQLFHREMN